MLSSSSVASTEGICGTLSDVKSPRWLISSEKSFFTRTDSCSKVYAIVKADLDKITAARSTSRMQISWYKKKEQAQALQLISYSGYNLEIMYEN